MRVLARKNPTRVHHVQRSRMPKLAASQRFATTRLEIPQTGIHLEPGIEICQKDYPRDWYQQEFQPYAEEYAALPDRRPETIVPWMRRYIEPAQRHFGDSLLLLAHYYMGGEIVKLVELFGGKVADSYQLALMAFQQPEKKVIVESAVHFMAEAIAMLAHSDQRVYITNPKAGCTMEMNAKDFMVEPALDTLNELYGLERILPICYMNTSGRIKAMTGEQGGAVCTSSNVAKIFRWALGQGRKILFIPDMHMGENVAKWVGISPEKIAVWPGGTAGATYNLRGEKPEVRRRFDEADLILFGSSCGVHTIFSPEMVEYWRKQRFNVAVHPECRKVVVDVADCWGSTAFLWDHVMNDRAGTQKYAIGTEGHMVNNLREAARQRGIMVVNLKEALVSGLPQVLGCGCATMSRNDPPHLVAMLDLLRQGRAPDINEVKAGDVVSETTGARERFDARGQAWVIENGRRALEKMIEITESN